MNIFWKKKFLQKLFDGCFFKRHAPALTFLPFLKNFHNRDSVYDQGSDCLFDKKKGDVMPSLSLPAEMTGTLKTQENGPSPVMIWWYQYMCCNVIFDLFCLFWLSLPLFESEVHWHLYTSWLSYNVPDIIFQKFSQSAHLHR